MSLNDLTPNQVTRRLTYAGLVLLAYELAKSMVVGPIKAFYADVNFDEGMPFNSYEEDVLSRHGNELEACLLYLRDFMEAIDSVDLRTFQALRKHRNELAHDLVDKLPDLKIDDKQSLFAYVDHTLFKVSNYLAYMEIGADPKFSGIEWSTAKGHEYVLFETVMTKLKQLNLDRSDAL